MGYYDNVNPTLLEQVPPHARRLLELGCGAGAMARAVRERLSAQPYYVGIELDPQALERARDALDLAVPCNLDQVGDWSTAPLLAEVAQGHFDHLIVGDVLEHLREPWQVLREAVTCLAPGGCVLACIPNVQHWSTWVQLARGSWPRSDSGLFDRTHLRWFTLDDMVALLREAGLVVDKVLPRVFQAEQGQQVMRALESLAQVAGADFDTLQQRGLPLQYVLVAHKPATVP